MSFTLVEGCVDDVLAYLSDNMTDKLITLDAEYRDFRLDPIKSYHIAELSEIPEQPVILVLGEYSEMEREGSNYIRGQHYLSIVVVATDQDRQILRRRIYRYVRAVIELLREARSSSGWKYAIVFDRLEYSAMYSDATNFLQDGRVNVHFNGTDTA